MRPAARIRGLAAGVTWALVIATGLALAHHSLEDPDLFLHDAAGREILAGNGLPRENRYSFTAPDASWVDHEWLFQVLVSATGELAGDDLAARTDIWNTLRVLLAAALLTALLCGERSARGRWWPPAWLALPAALALGVLWPRLLMRPELASVVLFVLVLRQAEAALREAPPGSWATVVDPRRPFGRATLLTLLWAQLHGFYALAALLWLASAAGTPRRPDVWRTAAMGAGLALLCGLLTPNLVSGFLYPWRAISQFWRPGPRLGETIAELAPLLRATDGLAWTIRAYLVSVAWGLVWIALVGRRLPPGRILIWLLAAVAAWQAQRNVGLYAVAFFLLHSGLRPGDVVLRWRLPPRAGALASPIAALLAVSICAVWLPRILDDSFYLREGVARRWGGGLTPAAFPLEAAAALDGGGRVANNVDAASTLIRLGSGQVCIDGRTEAYPAAAWSDYATLKAGGPAALALLERWRVDGVVLAHRNRASHPLLATLLAASAWQVVAADPAGVLLRPAGRSAGVDRSAVLGATTRALLADRRGGTRGADLCAAWAAFVALTDDDANAAALLRHARSLSPDHPVVLHNLGNQFLASGDLAGALAAFRRAADLNPRAAATLVNVGVCEFRLGRQGDAAAALGRATRLDPRRFEAWASLAEVLRAMGDTDGARRAYARALALREDPRLRARARELGG